MGGLRINSFVIPVFITLLLLLNNSAKASNIDAQKFTEKLSASALQIIKSDAKENKKQEKLTELFMRSVDVNWMGRFVMGKYWNEASDAQRKEYLTAYKNFLLRSYIPKFKEYNNQQIKIIKTRGEGLEYLVESKIISADGATINVDYKVRNDEGRIYMIFDVIAEGVSLIATQRSDFASVLSREGVDGLIGKLKSKG